MTPQEATQLLFQAARSGRINDAESALAAGTDPNARDGWQWTPLHLAALNGYADLARLLIAKGADPTAKDKWQQTPLNYAVDGGHAYLVRLLKEAARDKPAHADRVVGRRGSGEPQIGG